LLAEAKAQCDAGGLKAFKRKYCPNLGRSRIYELLAIGSGKKTFEQLRTEKRASVAKSRKKVSTTSVVVDKTEPADSGPSSTEPTDTAASTVSKQAELANLVPADQSAEAIKARFAADEPAPEVPPSPEPAEVEATPADEPARKKPIRKTPAPVGLDEASSAEQIGGFLERLGADRFFAALQFAPNLKAEIERRVIGVCAKKKTTAPPEPRPKINFTKEILGLPDVEDPALTKENILDTISRQCAVVQACQKVLKASSLDKEVKEQIDHAIGGLVSNWKSAQAALALDLPFPDFLRRAPSPPAAEEAPPPPSAEQQQQEAAHG
jgi:hypothetical protein